MADLLLFLIAYNIQKTWVLASACPTLRGLPQPKQKEQTEKHPRRSIWYTRKVCVEGTKYPQAHYGVVYDTPRGSHPSIVLVLLFRLWKFRRVQKQSVSNAF